MSLLPIHTFNQNKLLPFIAPELALSMPFRMQPSTTILAGAPVGMVSAAVNEVQTLTASGSPGSGTFTLAFDGFVTSALNYNATSTEVQAALQALPSIGVGNATCSGGALPGTPIVVTFAGTKAGAPQNLITLNSNSLNQGTVTPTRTTAGVFASGMTNWGGGLQTPPVAPTVLIQAGGSYFGDGTNAHAYQIQVSYYNETGETTPSPAAQVVAVSTNRTIRIAQISTVGAAVQGAYVYANGVRIANIAASGGNIPQTDIASIGSNAGSPVEVNGMYTARDGSHTLRGFAVVDMTSDAVGNITYGTQAASEHGQGYTNAPIYISGYFSVGDLKSITSTNGPQLSRFGKFMIGDYTQSGGIFRLAA